MVALRQYFSAMDGTKRDFSEVENLFDALFHDKFELASPCRKEIASRDRVKEIHMNLFSMGTKATIIHLERIGLDSIEVKFLQKNDRENKSLHIVHTIEDGKLARSHLVKMHWKIEKIKGKRRHSPMQSRYFFKGNEDCSNSHQLVAAGDEKEGMTGLA